MQNPNKYVLPKILIGIPTYEGKNYCLDAFMNNVNNFTYPKSNIEIFVADNSSSNERILDVTSPSGLPSSTNTTFQCSDVDKLSKRCSR
jgi:hypothetical protein